MKVSLLAAITIISLAVMPRKSALEIKKTDKTGLAPVVTSVKPSNTFGFCEANPANRPEIFDLGNIGYRFSKPAYIEYVQVNGQYYGFLVNNWPGKLLRLDFGTSLLNKPSVIDLGTVSDIVPNNTEGLEIVRDGDRWYAIIVGGDPRGGELSAIVKIDFGTDITNKPEGGENWGNVGELDYPHDLVVFKDADLWYGMTVNTWSHSITRFSFGPDFSKKPGAENLGNIGELNDPTGICLTKSQNGLFLFVTNATGRSISLLDFGNSILNQPTTKNFKLDDASPWDIEVIESCNQIVAYVVDALNGGLIRIKFETDGFAKTITYSYPGDFDFPHSLSKPFFENGDLYFFVPDANNHNLSRLKIAGCKGEQQENSRL